MSACSIVFRCLIYVKLVLYLYISIENEPLLYENPNYVILVKNVRIYIERASPICSTIQYSTITLY